VPLAAAGVSAAGSLLGGITGGKAAENAAKTQAAAYQKGIDEQHNEFATIQGNEQPYMQAGTTGLAAYLTLMGLGSGGATAQQSAIDALQSSPLFTSLDKSGTDALLQTAAATGGLRGGNTQAALYNNRASLLSTVIQNQLGNLGGLINIGQAGAAGTNAAATNTGTAITNLLGQQGGALASGTLGQANAWQNALNGISQAAGKYFNPTPAPAPAPPATW